MLLRFRTPEGQLRLQFQDSETLAQVLSKVSKELKKSPEALALAKDGQSLLPAAHPNSPIGSLLQHGDLLTVSFDRTETLQASAFRQPHHVHQADIDNLLERDKGLIKRDRSSSSSSLTFCKHGPQGMCEYCLPLEPYDPKYLEENKIKFMSYHAFLKLMMDKNKTQPISSPQFVPPLDEPSLRLRVPCPSGTHDPYPAGICTKCQPSAISLQSQTFRMVDHVEFESAALIDTFLSAWRQTGVQRFGYLFGRYEPYTEVPLGIKAVVVGVYEPSQEGWADGIQVDVNDPRLSSVDSLASSLGLQRVGMIYTDLLDDGTGTGKVICKRHADSYFLSSAECLSAAAMQHSFPVACRYSDTGKFGSRFVTCVLTGNEQGEIGISCFQISNIGVSMARDGIIEASVDPSLMRVVASSNQHYVPEVFYKYRNEYGIMVQEAAKPTFPVDYLIVTATHGFPSAPNPLFHSPHAFPVENRPGFGTVNIQSVKQHLDKGPLSEMAADFHFLIFLQDLHVIDKDDFELLLKALKTRTPQDLDQLNGRPSWQTFKAVLSAASTSGGSGGPSTSTGATTRSQPVSGPWACRHCTFVNRGTDCEMCGLPRD